MPFFVVLLLAGLDDALMHTPGQSGLPVEPVYRQVSDPFPGLVGNAGHKLQDLELAEAACSPVDGVHAPDQKPDSHAVAVARRGKRLRLGTAQPVTAGLRF